MKCQVTLSAGGPRLVYLTPENDQEKRLLEAFDGEMEVAVSIQRSDGYALRDVLKFVTFEVTEKPAEHRLPRVEDLPT